VSIPIEPRYGLIVSFILEKQRSGSVDIAGIESISSAIFNRLGYSFYYIGSCYQAKALSTYSRGGDIAIFLIFVFGGGNVSN
jgi:hypothetical protein